MYYTHSQVLSNYLQLLACIFKQSGNSVHLDLHHLQNRIYLGWVIYSVGNLNGVIWHLREPRYYKQPSFVCIGHLDFLLCFGSDTYVISWKTSPFHSSIVGRTFSYGNFIKKGDTC